MTTATDIEHAATRAAHHPWLVGLTRAGLAGFGLLHLLVAWLAWRIAAGAPADAGDQSGAFRALAGQPYGRVLVAAIGVGLLVMVSWQTLEATVGHHDQDGGRRVVERLVSAGRAVVYLYLAITAGKVVLRVASSSADQQQATSGELMSHDGGRWLVGAGGVALALVGLGLVVHGVSRGFEDHLDTGRMSATEQGTARVLGVLGYAAKGVAYGIAGVLLTAAAVTFDPGKARGLDAALRALAEQPHGGLLLGAVAAGLAAYAGHCFVQARYRRM
ncbi:DUF1206 domain-containing protein [Pilimelia columellifera]|uniref:DUF1206 domain-containing protein n=1 Tax=Pilimelia columellifera subsp. columellifera TaxID=706583 RepID=A0ABN3NQZ9_9ACTN